MNRDSSLNEKNSYLSLQLQTSFTKSAAVPCKYWAISKLIIVLVLKLFSGSHLESGLISLNSLAIKKKSEQFNKITHFYIEVSKGQTALGFSLFFFFFKPESAFLTLAHILDGFFFLTKKWYNHYQRTSLWFKQKTPQLWKHITRSVAISYFSGKSLSNNCTTL